MVDFLQLIKPKRCKENLKAYITPNKIILDFGISSIMLNCNTGYPNCIIDHKSLFGFEFENATTKYDKFINAIDIKDEWGECAINANDSTVLSAISGSGEDEFFIGALEICPSFKLSCYGFTYYNQYVSQKIIQNKGLNCYLDYTSIYYLYQLFKHLSGKKIDKLLWQINSSKFIFTNESKTFYIIIDQSNHIFNWKVGLLSDINKFYNVATANKNQVTKKVIIESMNSIGKHLIRPCGEVLDISEAKQFNKLEGNGYTLCLNKKK